jgi:hypothetical protein
MAEFWPVTDDSICNTDDVREALLLGFASVR